MNNTDQRSRNHDVLKENMFFEASASCVYVQNSTTQDGEQAFEPSPISFVIEENDTEETSLDDVDFFNSQQEDYLDEDEESDEDEVLVRNRILEEAEHYLSDISW